MGDVKSFMSYCLGPQIIWVQEAISALRAWNFGVVSKQSTTHTLYLTGVELQFYISRAWNFFCVVKCHKPISSKFCSAAMFNCPRYSILFENHPKNSRFTTFWSEFVTYLLVCTLLASLAKMRLLGIVFKHYEFLCLFFRLKTVNDFDPISLNL